MDAAMARLYRQLQARLLDRHFVEVAPAPPLLCAFLKPAAGLGDTRVLGVIDGRRTTDAVPRLFERVAPWFERVTGGHRGDGLLLFVYAPALATTVDAIRQSRFYAGSIPVTAGAYDLTSDGHWLSYGGAWDADLFGS
jgi:hypothetical protein